MNPPDVDALPVLVGAVYRALTQGAPRPTPDATTLPLLDRGLPADLYAIVYAWTYFGRPSGGTLRVWDIFDEWDFGFSVAPVDEREVKRICNVLAPGSRKAYPPGPYVQIGFDAGGITIFAGSEGGTTKTFGPEDGEDFGDIDGMLFRIHERADFLAEPALEPFVEPGFFPSP